MAQFRWKRESGSCSGEQQSVRGKSQSAANFRLDRNRDDHRPDIESQSIALWADCDLHSERTVCCEHGNPKWNGDIQRWHDHTGQRDTGWGELQLYELNLS